MQVRLRLHVASKDFKGSCFVEMADEASMAALVAKSAAGELVHDGAVVRVEPKLEYLQRVKEERLARGGKGESDDDDEAEAPTFDKGPLEFSKGVVLRFTLGAEADKESLRYETIKEAAEKFGKVQVRSPLSWVRL